MALDLQDSTTYVPRRNEPVGFRSLSPQRLRLRPSDDRAGHWRRRKGREASLATALAGVSRHYEVMSVFSLFLLD